MMYLRDEEQKVKAYKIVDREDKNNTVFFCKDRLEQNIREHVRGYSPWEEQIVIDELIKKGALQPV